MILQFSFKIILFTLFLWLGLSTSNGFADSPRTLHQAKYEGEYDNFNIDMTRTLVHLGGDLYRLETKTKNLFGSITEKEIFMWPSQKIIRPISYRYKQNIFGITKKRKVQYDWKSLTATSEYKKKKKTIAITNGVLGPMTYQLMIQIDLLAGNKQFEYSFIDRGKLKKYAFAKSATESIHYQNITISKAVKLTRENEGRKKKTAIWFDTEKHFTLSLIKQTKRNDEHTLFVTSSIFSHPLNNTPLYSLVFPVQQSKKNQTGISH